jgi:glycerol-3-phosphate dehydrogenase
MQNLSAAHRAAHLQQLSTQEFDLLVIGGGITGAGIALDAALRGLKVALVEMQDFAAGTSSRSTKLIHGGLRYLKQLEVGLVMETGREREVLHRNAPHLVVPEKMLLPLVKNGTYGPLATSFGLWVYDVLAGVKDDEQRVMLSREAALAQEPLLREDILEGAGLYIEYRTDDARLTIEVIKTAVAAGAICLNYAQAVGFTYNQRGKVASTQVKDGLTGQIFTVKARKTVNATGPWVDTVRQQDSTAPNTNKHLRLTKGVHLVLPRHRLPVRQAIYFDVPDGRMIFAVPRQGVTYLGTTDTNYEGAIHAPTTTAEDVDYLLRSANHMFPSLVLTPADVLSSWAGLRPLIHEAGKAPSELSRKDEIFISEGGLISIAGGKLTGYRKMAQRVVDLVARKLRKRFGLEIPASSTEQQVLSGGAFESPAHVHEHAQALAHELAPQGLPETYARYLTFNFGTQASQVMARLNVGLAQGLPPEQAALNAELDYCFAHEGVLTLADFFVRRTGRLYFERPGMSAQIEGAAHQLAALRGDRSAWLLLEDFKKEYEQAVKFQTVERKAVAV